MSFINEVLRYMGTYRNFKPEDNNQKIEIKLYRWQYGIKITATDFTEGTVIFRCNDASSLKLKMQSNPSGVSTMQHYLQFPLDVEGPTMTDCEDLLEFAEYPIADKMEIVYLTPAGEEVLLWTSGFYNFPFKRMKMYTLEFSLSNAIANGGIAAELVENKDASMEEVSWGF